MRRRLFNALCVLSTVILVASATVWVRGIWAQDIVWIPPTHRGVQIGVVTGHHSVTLMWGLDFGSPYGWGSSADDDDRVYNPYSDDLKPNLLVMSYNGGSGTLGFLSIPYWAMLCTSLILPSIWCLRRLLCVGVGLRACAACGYDLRGTKGPTCPECGVSRAVPAANSK